jgi:hypothetical protein
MPTFLQPVLVPERCYLFEALLWVAFQRLPILTTDHEGVDIRQSAENRESGEAGYAVKVIDDYIFDEECDRAGIPQDPIRTMTPIGTPSRRSGTPSIERK